MANANWYEQFEFRLWLADPQVSALSPASRGIWFDALCAMLSQGSYKLSGTLAALARTCRCSEAEMDGAVVELKSTGCADIHEARNGEIVTVTVLSRRLKRRVTLIEEERKRAKNRQKRYREAHRNARVTLLSRQSNATYKESYSESESEKTEEPPNPPRGGGTRAFDVAIPDCLQTKPFLAAWDEWGQHRREKRARLTTAAAKRQLAKFAEWGEARAIAAIHHSVQNGWTGIFEPDRTGSAIHRESDGERTLRILRERQTQGGAA